MSDSLLAVLALCVNGWICTAYRTGRGADSRLICHRGPFIVLMLKRPSGANRTGISKSDTEEFSGLVLKAQEVQKQNQKNCMKLKTIEPTSEANVSVDGFQDLFQPPRLSKPEMHLFLKPYFLLDRHADRFKPIEYVYTVLEKGRVITRGWCVQPHFKYGMPGAFDRDVTTVIYELVNENYFARSIKVPEMMPIGTLRDFAGKMQIAPSGQNLAAIKDSLNRLKSTLIDAQETFFDNKKKRYVSLRVTLLRGFILAGEEDENGRKYEQNYVLFDETVLSNLNSGYVMVIDVDSFRKLKSNIAKQLRMHLDHRFFIAEEEGQDYWVADYDWLAIHLGIKEQKELWRAKQQLQEAHEELKATSYIADYQWDRWRIIYRPGEAWKGEQLRRKSGKKNPRKPTRDNVEALVIDHQISPEEQKASVLARQAARILAGCKPDEDALVTHGLTVDDARCKAAELRKRPTLD